MKYVSHFKSELTRKEKSGGLTLHFHSRVTFIFPEKAVAPI